MYYDSLHRYAYTILKNNHDAADIVQLVFAKWWERGESLIIHQDIRQYLYRTVHNQCLNFLRNKKNRKTHSIDFFTSKTDIGALDCGDPLERKELRNRLACELEKLPPQCKLIFYKSRFEERKYAEIATELNLSIKTVEAQMGKALRILRERLYGQNINMLLFITFFLNRIL
jgi:RNA polymerase sigma-70 factor (ECF subfamily)